MKDYATIAKNVRKDVLTLVHKAQTSHIGSNFSVIDLAVVLYENLKEGDRVVWSKGWAAATIYTMLERQGTISKEQRDSFPNPPFIGLAETSVEGVEVSGGAMGHGLPVAVGMALGMRRSGDNGTVYCIMSDGEMQEGTTWEALLVASHHYLNMTIIIDYNKWCAMGRTNEVTKLEPLWRRFDYLGCAYDIDGHSYWDIEKALNQLVAGPKIIVANTIKGKGVSFMEDHLLYHYKYVDDDEYARAMKELE